MGRVRHRFINTHNSQHNSITHGYLHLTECQVSTHFYDDYSAELRFNTVIYLRLFTSIAEIIRNYEYDLALLVEMNDSLRNGIKKRIILEMKSK